MVGQLKPQYDTIRRSMLFMPVNNESFVAKAWLRGADAVVLDLEDSIAANDKIQARSYLREAVRLSARGGGDVLVRINNEPAYLDGDIEASIFPGVDCLAIPKVETAENIAYIEEAIMRCEKAQGMREGSIETYLIFETAKGYVNMQNVLPAAKRAKSMTLGTEDFVADVGITVEDNWDLLGPKLHMVVTACAYGLRPMGLIGSHTNFKDTDALYTIMRKSFRMGCTGTAVIHPGQVAATNKAYTPTEDEVRHAQRVVDALAQGAAEGKGAVVLDGKMTDLAHLVRAERTLQIMRAINRREEKKRVALERNASVSA